MLSPDTVRRYAWADDEADLAWTVAVVAGCTVTEVVRAYGGDPRDEPRTMKFREAVVPPEQLGQWTWLLVREHDGKVVALENNGWFGSRAAVAQRASAGGGQFMSVSWDLNANCQVTEAIDGELVASFDPLAVDQHAPSDVYPDWLREVVFTDESLHAVLLAVLCEQTGVAAEHDWLDASLVAWQIR